MCFVSVLTTNVQHQIQQPVKYWPYQQATEFSEIIKRLDALDQKLGLRDCHDVEKAAFIKALSDRIAELEQQMSK